MAVFYHKKKASHVCQTDVVKTTSVNPCLLSLPAPPSPPHPALRRHPPPLPSAQCRRHHLSGSSLIKLRALWVKLMMVILSCTPNARRWWLPLFSGVFLRTRAVAKLVNLKSKMTLKYCLNSLYIYLVAEQRDYFFNPNWLIDFFIFFNEPLYLDKWVSEVRGSVQLGVFWSEPSVKCKDNACST